MHIAIASHMRRAVFTRRRPSLTYHGFRCEPLERRVFLCAQLHANGLTPSHAMLSPLPVQPVTAEQILAAIELGERTARAQSVWVAGGNATINWVNRGSDGFNAVFGAAAPMARNVVDAALIAWQRVITDFNWPDNPDDNTFEVTINMSGSGCGGSADTGADDDGVPQDGAINILNGSTCGNSGLGWFLDPTPFDSSEYRGEIINAYAADGTPGSLAATEADLYTIVVVEMTHLLGISGDEDFLFEDLNNNNPPFNDTGIGDAAFPVGTLWTYAGPAGGVLFTDNNGGSGGSDTDEPLHTAEPVPANNVNGRLGAQDVGNAVFEGGRRYHPSRLIAQVMNDIYPFAITMPEQFGTSYANFDPGTGNLLIRGGMDGQDDNGDGIADAPYGPTVPSNDTFTLKREGGQLRVDQMIGKPVPGTNVPLVLSSFFDFSQIQTITMLSGDSDGTTDGGDFYGLDLSGGTVIPPGGITVSGGTGYDRLSVFDSPASQSYIVNGTTVVVGGRTITYDTIDDITLRAGLGSNNNTFRIDDTAADTVVLHLIGSDGVDTIDVEAKAPATLIDIEGRGGDDDLYLSLINANLDSIAGNIAIEGQAGEDVLVMYDHADNSDNLDQFVPAAFFRNGTLGVFYDITLDEIELRSGSGEDIIEVRGTEAGVYTRVLGGLGDDQFYIDSNAAPPDADTVDFVRSTVEIDGQLGSDYALLNDSSDGSTDTVTVTETTVGAGPTDTFFGAGGALVYRDLADLEIRMGRPGDLVNIRGTWPGTDVVVWGGQGGDDFRIDSNGRDVDGTADGVRSEVEIHGDGGDDTLAIDDEADTTGDTVTVTAGAIGGASGDNFFGAGGSLEYDDLVAIGLFLGLAGDSAVVRATALGTTTTISAGDGDDSLSVDNNGPDQGGRVDFVQSHVVFQGGAGSDSLLLEDRSDGTPDLVTITPTEIGAGAADAFFAADGRLTYQSLSSVTLHGGTLGNTVNVAGTSVGTTYTLNTGPGPDSVTVAATQGPVTINAGGSNDIIFIGTGDLDDIAAGVVVNGEGFADAVVLDDEAHATGAAHIITPTGVFRTGFAGLTYGTIEGLTLDAPDGVSNINIEAIPAGLTLNLNAGGGNDLINLGTGELLLDLLLGAVNVDGEAGVDTLTLHDAADTTGDTVSITPTSVGAAPGDTLFGPGGSLASYTSIDLLTVNLSTGLDTVFVTPSATTAYTVNDPPPPPVMPTAVGPAGGGDVMKLNLAGVTDVVFTPSGPGAGRYAFGNRRPLVFSGIEQVTTEVSVEGRFLFYDNSAFDRGGRTAPDDAAVAPDKRPLRPGESATHANLSGYRHGINGMMIDVFGLPEGAAPSADDFTFLAGTTADPARWGRAPLPLGITRRPGAGAGGGDRITLVWADGAIRNTWLQVGVLATGDTGLRLPDVFYFGSLVGESGEPGGGPPRSGFVVSAFDYFATRAAASGGGAAPIHSAHDFNRDARVGAADLAIVRSNIGARLELLNAPAVVSTSGSGGGGVFTSRAPIARRGVWAALASEPE